MKAMQKRITYTRERFNALQVRERVLAGAAALAVIYMIWHRLVMPSVYDARQATSQEVVNMNTELAGIEKHISTLMEERDGAAVEGVQRQIESIRNAMRELESSQGKALVEFIPPREMVDVLKELIIRMPELTLLKVQSQPARPLSLPESKNAGQTPVLKIYEHGVIIEFLGNYYSSLQYFRKLESLPWKFHWDFAGYQVQEYPQARIRLVIHTLSLSEALLGV